MAEKEKSNLDKQNADTDPVLPRKSAVALSYDKETHFAPKVVAKGRGEMAKRIIEAAKENNVYVHESPELISLLMQVDLDAYIPPNLYMVVAELLAWLYRLEHDQKLSKTHKKPPLAMTLDRK